VLLLLTAEAQRRMQQPLDFGSLGRWLDTELRHRLRQSCPDVLDALSDAVGGGAPQHEALDAEALAALRVAVDHIIATEVPNCYPAAVASAAAAGVKRSRAERAAGTAAAALGAALAAAEAAAAGGAGPSGVGAPPPPAAALPAGPALPPHDAAAHEAAPSRCVRGS
jgi:hypothetical protein